MSDGRPPQARYDEDPPLGSKVDVVLSDALTPHAGRGALILVDGSLDLAVVADAVADDHTAAIEAWISRGMLKRPAPEEVHHEPPRPYRFIIVQPFVLAQGPLTEDVE